MTPWDLVVWSSCIALSLAILIIPVSFFVGAVHWAWKNF